MSLTPGAGSGSASTRPTNVTPSDPAGGPSATDRLIKGSPDYKAGEEFEFFEWRNHLPTRGVPWRDKPEDLSALMAEGWEVMTVCDTMTVLFRDRVEFGSQPERDPAAERPRTSIELSPPLLPDDLADAFELMKLALMRHRAEEWHEIPLHDTLEALAYLMNVARGEYLTT